MPGSHFRGRRLAWLWMIGRLFAVFAVLWIRRTFARLRDGHEACLLDEWSCAIAPLVLFAIFWLLVDSAPPPDVRVIRNSEF